MKIIEWIKNNKLTALLILIIAFLLFKDQRLIRPIVRQTFEARNVGTADIEGAPAVGGGLVAEKVSRLSVPPLSEPAPQPDVEERMVVEESNVSLVVKDVRQKVDQIIKQVEEEGGYMVSSSVSQPQEAPFANLVVRVPKSKLRPTLEFLRKMAIKVTSENLKGWDVTDQYFDIEARLENLDKTKAKYEEILDKATTVDQILRVQRELTSLQSQIDQLKGQQQYLEKTAENAKLTCYLAEDEWSLPYTPEEPTFRPKVIFKQAVRSLVQTLRGLAKLGIWFGVYSAVWVPLLAILWFWKKYKKKHY